MKTKLWFLIGLMALVLSSGPAGAQYGYGSRPLTSKLNISSSTVLKTTNGVLVTINVTTAGSAVGSVYDSATTGAAATLIATIPNTAGTYYMQFPFFVGLLVIPGTGQVVSVSYQ